MISYGPEPCTDGLQMAHSDNPRLYVRCEQGGWVLKTCLDGWVYDSTEGSCQVRLSCVTNVQRVFLEAVSTVFIFRLSHEDDLYCLAYYLCTDNLNFTHLVMRVLKNFCEHLSSLTFIDTE